MQSPRTPTIRGPRPPTPADTPTTWTTPSNHPAATKPSLTPATAECTLCRDTTGSCGRADALFPGAPAGRSQLIDRCASLHRSLSYVAPVLKQLHTRMLHCAKTQPKGHMQGGADARPIHTSQQCNTSHLIDLCGSADMLALFRWAPDNIRGAFRDGARAANRDARAPVPSPTPCRPAW